MIAIVGKGNVGQHLYKALKDKTEVTLVNSRALEDIPNEVDTILLCVSDDAIEEVASKLPDSDALIVHVSGSKPMDILKSKGNRYGVFYPLQTFTEKIELNYKEIPVFVEGSSPEVVNKLKSVASLFSDLVMEKDSEARKRLHLASVFACNFTNALAGVANDLLKDEDIDFSILLPLLMQTINKLGILTPEEGQTGPAVRGDKTVMNSHIEMLKDKPELQDLYIKLSSLIANKKIHGSIL